MAHLITSQTHLVEELRRYGIEVMNRGQVGLLAHLTVRPILIDKIKAAQKVDSELSKIREEAIKGRKPEFRIADEDVMVRSKALRTSR